MGLAHIKSNSRHTYMHDLWLVFVLSEAIYAVWMSWKSFILKSRCSFVRGILLRATTAYEFRVKKSTRLLLTADIYVRWHWAKQDMISHATCSIYKSYTPLSLPEALSLLSASATRQRPIYIRQSLCTRQRTLGKQLIGKDLFAECTLSGTRQCLCRVLIWHSAKKSRRDGERHRDGGFAECQGQALGKGRRFAERHWLRHSAKVAVVSSATGKTLGKQATFAEFLAHGTQQICDVCRVQWLLHSAKHVPR